MSTKPVLPLDEWIAKSLALVQLRVNLRTNLEAMTEISELYVEDLTRLNMIMVRQCLQDLEDEKCTTATR